jgi:hypothetical protein
MAGLNGEPHPSRLGRCPKPRPTPTSLAYVSWRGFPQLVLGGSQFFPGW